MKRRPLLVAPLALAFSRPGWGQPAIKVWRVGFLSVRQEPELQAAFVRGMRELGYSEGKNLLIESRSAEGKTERMAGLAADLARLGVDAIVTAGTVATSAARGATSTIPIVMGASADPVGNGFVKSLAHPGGNITGMSTLRTDTSPKLLELLKSAVPGLSRVAMLVNPSNTAQPLSIAGMKEAAQSLRLTILPVQARSEEDIEAAFMAIAQSKVGAMVVMRDGVFLRRRQEIADFAARQRLAVISDIRDFVDAGTLMSYGPSLTDQLRRVATHLDKIFKGAKPGDLPVEQPTKFELVVNLRTAKALGLTIPQSLLVLADEVIH